MRLRKDQKKRSSRCATRWSKNSLTERLKREPSTISTTLLQPSRISTRGGGYLHTREISTVSWIAWAKWRSWWSTWSQKVFLMHTKVFMEVPIRASTSVLLLRRRSKQRRGLRRRTRSLIRSRKSWKGEAVSVSEDSPTSLSVNSDFPQGRLTLKARMASWVRCIKSF